MSNKKDDFGDRMKFYEMAEAGRKFMPLLPIIARIDGRCFSRFTNGLGRPYDIRLSNLMIDTTKFLVKETNANCGYTQSDEITLGWYVTDYDEGLFFGGRISKITSTLAALATVYFNKKLRYYLPIDYWDKMPTFDCRAWNVPNLVEATNAFLWREKDATKNSISMAARNYYSHNELDKKNSSEMQEMLFKKGINWNDYPTFFKRGTYVQRQKTIRKFTKDELNSLPAKHDVFSNPDLQIERTDYVTLELPPLTKVVNREKVIFFGEKPFVNDLSNE